MSPKVMQRLQSLAALNRAAGDEMSVTGDRFHKMKHRHENGSAPRAVIAPQLFQTPEGLAERLVALLGDITGKSVLEPQAGCGRLVRALKKAGAGDITGIDIAADCVAVTKPLVDDMIHADFLQLTPEKIGHFDCIAMNPPFTMRSDIKHILHARKFLFHRGKIAGLCMAGQKREDELKPLCDTWERIPAGTFKEAGTQIETILFSMIV